LPRTPPSSTLFPYTTLFRSLEELDGQPLVDRVVLGQLQGDAHHVEAEHGDPAGRVGLLQHRAVGAPLAAIDDGDVVQAEEAALRSEEHTSELQSLAYLVCRL